MAVWLSALAGIAVAVAILIPIAIKWQLPLRVVAAWAVAVGGVSGAAWARFLSLGSLTWEWVVWHALTVVSLSLAVAALAFFRDPEREPPSSSGVVVSPADGTIVYVRPFSRGTAPPMHKHGRPIELREFSRVDISGDGYVIGIGMHLLNVHVNRAPVGGSVRTLLHTPGRFESLRRDGATSVNERYTTVIDSERAPVVVVQIASRLVRRIVSYLRVGEDVGLGQRIGMIKFGSQVDLILPASDELELLVAPGDKVRAGVSTIGRYVLRNPTKE